MRYPRLLILLVFLLFSSPAAFAQDKPNIVLILMDNFGYGEIGVYGGGVLRGAPTPNIDSIAAEGLQLTNFNVEAECTPSRSALMTGRYGIRTRQVDMEVDMGSDQCNQLNSQTNFWDQRLLMLLKALFSVQNQCFKQF
jgi:arylsulfatase A-like enzyme